MKRAGVVQVTGEAIAEMLGWPSDHRAVFVRFDPYYGTFDFLLEGPEMPLQIEGAHAKVVKAPSQSKVGMA